GRRGAVAGGEHREGLPPLGAGHAPVDRVVGGRRQADRLAFLEVDVQAAARRAKAAGHGRGGVGQASGGGLAQSELAASQFELARQLAAALVEQRTQATRPERRVVRVGFTHGASAPGILGATAAVKNNWRSSSSPSSV